MPNVIDNVANFAKAPVVGTYNAAATSVNLASGFGARFPTPPFNAIWWNATAYPDPSDDPNREIIRVLTITGDQLSSILRGQEISDKGLPASNKDTPGVVYMIAQVLSAKTIRDISTAAVDVGNLTVYVTERGAKGDGTTVDLTSINQAITDGNIVLFPPGTYIVDGAIALKSNLVLRGSGIGVTTIKLKNAAGTTHMFSGSALSNVRIEDMTIDGNEAQNATGLDAFHLNGLDGGWFLDLEVKNVRRGGIVLGNDFGSVKHVLISGCRITVTRGHGIEIDNRNSDNVGNVISDCQISQAGYLNTGLAAIQAFGKVAISNCAIEGVDGDNYGIWLRADDATYGAGAHRSSVSNCVINGSVSVSTNSEGVKCDANICSIVGVGVQNCDRGIRVAGDDNSFQACRAEGGDAGCYVEGDRNRIANGYFQASGSGNACIDVRSTADETTIIGNRILAQSSASKVVLSGTNTHASRNIGWKTEAIVETSDIANNSAGASELTIAHGLDVTPTVQQCNVSLRWVTLPSDIAALATSSVSAIRGPLVDSADGTNVKVCYSIVTQATTGGASTFRIVVHINALP